MYGQGGMSQPMYPGAGHRNVAGAGGGGTYSTGGFQQAGGAGIHSHQSGMGASSEYSTGDDSRKPGKDTLAVAIRWMKTRNEKEKMMLAVATGIVVRSLPCFVVGLLRCKRVVC